MPFLELKCNNVPIQKISGIELATGFKIEASDRNNNSMFGDVDRMNQDSRQQNSNKKEGNIYAIAGLILVVLSLVLAFGNRKAGIGGAILSGVLGGIALVGLLVDVKQQISDEIKPDDNFLIRIDFTPWFYLSVLAAFTGAYFCYKRLNSIK